MSATTMLMLAVMMAPNVKLPSGVEPACQLTFFSLPFLGHTADGKYTVTVPESAAGKAQTVTLELPYFESVDKGGKKDSAGWGLLVNRPGRLCLTTWDLELDDVARSGFLGRVRLWEGLQLALERLAGWGVVVPPPTPLEAAINPANRDWPSTIADLKRRDALIEAARTGGPTPKPTALDAATDQRPGGMGGLTPKK